MVECSSAQSGGLMEPHDIQTIIDVLQAERKKTDLRTTGRMYYDRDLVESFWVWWGNRWLFLLKHNFIILLFLFVKFFLFRMKNKGNFIRDLFATGFGNCTV